MEQQKAAKVRPPQPLEPEYIDVNMTSVFTTLGILGVFTAGLTASTAYLWKKTRRNEEYLEALREYVARLVNDTECGHVAYQNIVERAEEEDAVDWSEDEATLLTPNEDEEEEEGDGIRRLYTPDALRRFHQEK